MSYKNQFTPARKHHFLLTDEPIDIRHIDIEDDDDRMMVEMVATVDDIIAKFANTLKRA